MVAGQGKHPVRGGKLHHDKEASSPRGKNSPAECQNRWKNSVELTAERVRCAIGNGAMHCCSPLTDRWGRWKISESRAEVSSTSVTRLQLTFAECSVRQCQGTKSSQVCQHSPPWRTLSWAVEQMWMHWSWLNRIKLGINSNVKLENHQMYSN